MEDKLLMKVENLAVDYVTERGNIRACDNISFELKRGEILGIAGESASGKSTLLNAISRLQSPPAVTAAGRVLYYPKDSDKPIDFANSTEEELKQFRWKTVSIVMQSAMTALNPVLKLGTQFTDVITTHDKNISEDDAKQLAAETLEMVGIPAHRLNSYSYELSGGMQQRALIALSLVCNPDVIMMDEPTTAVDVIMQKQILSQILKLKEKFGFAICFVTHDLALLLELSDTMLIMYGGKVVEMGSNKLIDKHPLHPYTHGLRNSYPPLSGPIERKEGIPGKPPNLLKLPVGCSFAPRCPQAEPACEVEAPKFMPVETPIGTSVNSCIKVTGQIEEIKSRLTDEQILDVVVKNRKGKKKQKTWWKKFKKNFKKKEKNSENAFKEDESEVIEDEHKHINEGSDFK